MSKHPLYSTWQGMKQRCTNQKHSGYYRYGGRGIFVCERWMNSFQDFCSDMGEKPEGTTLDRKDNSKGYSKENCRWATKDEQQLNRENTRYVFVDGVKHKAAILAMECGLKTDTIVERANKGLTIDELLDPERRVFVNGLSLGGKANGLKNLAKTHCPRGHEYTPDNIRPSGVGGRGCKKCHTILERGRREKRKLKAITSST